MGGIQNILESGNPIPTINENGQMVDFVTVYAKDPNTTTGLTWGYCGGRWGGFLITAGTLTLTDNADNYIVVSRTTGAVSASTAATSWDDNVGFARCYIATTSGGVVTSIEDHRCGPLGMLSGAGGLVADVITDGVTTIAPSQNAVFDALAGKQTTTLTNGNILIGNGSNLAASVTVTGDMTITNAGVTAIATGAIVNADINAGAGIDASKLADGSVSNTEFQHLDGVTSAIQTQLGARELSANKGGANGYCPLDVNSVVPLVNLPDTVLGAMQFQSTWNASTNTPTIPAASSSNDGHYYIVSVAGSTSVSGVTDWEVGDWVVSNGSTWAKIDNSDKVSSVAGKTGVVTLAVGDIAGQSGTTLMGRHAGGSGAGQEVSVGNGLEFSGAGIRRGALTGAITAAAGSNTTALGLFTLSQLNTALSDADLSTSSEIVDLMSTAYPSVTGASTATEWSMLVKRRAGLNRNRPWSAVAYAHGITAVAYAYTGACYSPTQNRIYLVPRAQANQTNWHYIDCGTGAVVAYAHGVTAVASAYIGACYSPTQNRIYLVPFAQANQTNWHYIDCGTGAVVAYAHGITAVASAYTGACYSPTQNRIYLVPYAQANQADWHYIDCGTGAVVAYAHGVTAVASAYIGACYSPTQNRIYLVPFAQANQTNWHYIDCDTGAVVAYAHGVTALFNAYIGACYSPTQNRIYLVPYAQANQTNWHYIDCDTGAVVAYAHGVTAVASAYYGACYSPTQNRIYLVPYAQANQTNWHYIDCGTGAVVAYAHGITAVASAYSGACYSPTQNRIYLVPRDQANQTNWHYINHDTLDHLDKSFFGSSAISSTL